VPDQLLCCDCKALLVVRHNLRTVWHSHDPLLLPVSFGFQHLQHSVLLARLAAVSLCCIYPSPPVDNICLDDNRKDCQLFCAVLCTPVVHPPLPSNRHHRSNGDCLEDKRENYQVCSMQYCVQQLCTVQCSHTWTDLTVLWIGFCLTGPISLCLDSFLCM